MSTDGNVNVLLVDDRRENLLALEAILDGMELNLYKASSGEEALKFLLKADFAVILLDVQMPGLSGFATAELIKARDKTRDIPIIFLTAINKEDRYVFEGYSVGAVDYMFKPFQPNILRSKVQVFVDLYVKTRQIRVQAEEMARQAEELNRQKQFNELLLNSAGGAICGLDDLGRVTFINPAAASALGYEVSELIGVSLHETVHHSLPDGSPYPDADCAMNKALSTGASHRAEDEVFWRKDGTPLPVEYISSPICENGLITGAVLGFIDISARKKAEEEVARRTQELELANQRLIEADRYKDEFLSVLSHELRTPINAITGFGSILDDEVAGPLSDMQHDYLKKILGGADVLLSLVNDLLDMSRITAGKFAIFVRPMSFPRVVQQVVDSIKPLAEAKSHQIRNEVPEDLPDFSADDQRVAQVLVNLVNNAIKFTPEGGEITVRACVVGDHLRCEVQDNGVGIAEKDMPKLFQRFTQLDSSSTREAGGTGLGLAITKTLVESHGGRIGVESKPEHGSTFWFELPLISVEASVGAVVAAQSR